ncbi:MAG TPA: Fic family protein [Sedimentisphaerales bacterium]|nr:Fic family protein [Sedimentisphaerales bacterium]
MRKPKYPPDLQSIWRNMATDSAVVAKFMDAISSAMSDEYLHWDKLRYHTPPEGLSHEQWWLATKKQRQSLFRKLPLTDKSQKPFQYLTNDFIAESLQQIDHSVGAFNEMPEQIKNTETKNRYYVNSLIQEAFTSSQLEGAATTRLVAKEMIRTGRPPCDKSEQMILNNYAAMKRINKLKDEPLSRQLVFDIHQLVTDKTLDTASAAGRFRTANEDIHVIDMYNEVFHDPPPARQLEERMEAMCAFANGQTPGYFVHPVIRAIILHFWLAYDHPFVDGNGRTARSLFYWSVLRHRYWLFEFVSISQIIVRAPARYARAFLYTETDDNDLTYFVVYHLDIVHRAINAFYEYVERKTKRLQAIEDQLRGMIVLNHRQRALIAHAVRNPRDRYTIRSHQISHNVVYQTARTDLLDLEKRGFLACQKIGKTWYFTPVSDLEERLAKLD